MQLTMFSGNKKFTINKPIRLIELFSGYGSQALALKYLGVNFEHWRTCEWAVKSIQAYKDIHFAKDNTDYSKDLTKEQLIDYLYSKGISSNYNEPMSYEQIKRLGEEKLRTIYNNIQATHNLVNIQQVKGNDLGIVDADNYCYIITYSFPCQDLSNAGLGKGMAKDSGTRSGMLWEVERILDELKTDDKDLPQILLMENVPQVHGTKNKESFNEWCEFLKSLGYSNYWQDLNAKDFGVPQNRKRCYMISVLDNYRYDFPQKIELKLKLSDLLENNVDEKYYLSDSMKDYCFGVNQKESKFPRGQRFIQSLNMTNKKNIASCITTSPRNRPVDNFICKDLPENFNLNDICGTKLQREVCNKALAYLEPTDTIDYTYSNSRLKEMDNGYIKTKNKENNQIMNTITTQSENFAVCVEDKQNTLKGFLDNDCRTWKDEKISGTLTTNGKTKIVEMTKLKSINETLEKNLNKLQDGKFIDGYNRAVRTDDVSNTITTRVDASNNYGVCVNDKSSVKTNLRIRKLTPKECFRLMGVKDADFELVSKNQSNASLYHLAGDSIVVDVLVAIFKEFLNKE